MHEPYEYVHAKNCIIHLSTSLTGDINSQPVQIYVVSTAIQLLSVIFMSNSCTCVRHSASNICLHIFTRQKNHLK